MEPLGLHAWLGVPLAATADVAWLIPALPPSDPEAARLDAEAAAHPMIRSGFTMNGSLPFPGEPDDLTYNDPDVIGAEIAAAAVVTDARSLARLWAACVSEVAGTPLLSEASIEDAIVERSTGTQRYGYVDPRFRWGTGFMLDSPPVRPMLGPRSFGHDGAGGDLGFADADRRVGFGYVVNRMRGMPDERMTLLTEAVHGCLRGR